MQKLKTELEQKRAIFTRRPTIKQNGKMIDLRKFVETAREDTEIYPTLYKYGCLDPLKNTSIEEIQKDYIELMSAKEQIMFQDRAKEMFERLPAIIKEKFDNDYQKFVEQGEDFLNAINRNNNNTNRDTKSTATDTKEA